MTNAILNELELKPANYRIQIWVTNRWVDGINIYHSQEEVMARLKILDEVGIIARVKSSET